ncbi:hypothetical protein [Sulfitobacter sp. 915]|uniref:hypothetical protein n=1 Tax=Sulfitobacter sp. 915 TaxID=3368558 RepID=UPI00374613C1
MADESNPWQGVALVPEQPRATQPPVERRSPLDERTLNQAEVLAGLRGDKSEHAVRFKDLENLKREVAKDVAGVGKYGDTGTGRTGSVGEQIAAQFAAIDTESKALLKDYNKLFDQAMEGIETLGEEVDGQFQTFQTQLDGNSTSISSLIVSVDGVKAQYGIRINNNGHISGFGLLSRLINGQPVSDFIINDASLRVVNSSGQGNFTPFAVYPTSRFVDGAYVPAGVHAHNLYVTRANIGNLAVDTLKIAGYAVTVPSFAVGSTKTGNGSFQLAASTGVVLAGNLADLFIFWNVRHGYSDGPRDWGYQIMCSATQVDFRNGMTFGNDYPSGCARISNVSGTNVVVFNWRGEDDTITAQVSLQILARMK